MDKGEKQTRRRLFLLLLIILPLMAGAILYCVTAPDVAFVRMLQKLIPMLPVGMIRLPQWLRNYAFDAIWAWSFALTMMWLFYENKWKQSIGAMLTVAFEICIEIMQTLPFIHGTFDMTDIFVEFITDLFVLMLWRKRL